MSLSRSLGEARKNAVLRETRRTIEFKLNRHQHHLDDGDPAIQSNCGISIRKPSGRLQILLWLASIRRITWQVNEKEQAEGARSWADAFKAARLRPFERVILSRLDLRGLKESRRAKLEEPH